MSGVALQTSNSKMGVSAICCTTVAGCCSTSLRANPCRHCAMDDRTDCDLSPPRQRMRKAWLRSSFVLMDSWRGPSTQAPILSEPNSLFGGGSDSPRFSNGPSGAGSSWRRPGMNLRLARDQLGGRGKFRPNLSSTSCWSPRHASSAHVQRVQYFHFGFFRRGGELTVLVVSTFN